MEQPTELNYIQPLEEVFQKTDPVNTFDEKDLTEDYEEYEDDAEIVDDGDDEEEEYPCVYYNLDTKPVINVEKERALKEKMEQIQKRKKEEEEAQIHLSIKENSAVSFTLKKVNKLVSYRKEVKSCCYIPEKNILVMLMGDGKIVKIFSSINFKVVATINTEKKIRVVRYSKDCGMIYLGGEDFYMEMYSIQTFKTEALTKLQQGCHIEEIQYIKRHNAVFVGTSRAINVLSSGLVPLFKIGTPSYYSVKDIIDFQGNYLIATSSDYGYAKQIHLCNLKTRKVVDTSKITIPLISSIEITKKSPLNVITCLGHGVQGAVNNGVSYPLVQLSLDQKREKLVLYKSGLKAKYFSHFKRIQNSNYYIVKYAQGANQIFSLMEISGDDIQLLKNFPGKDCNFLNSNILTMINSAPLLVGADLTNAVCVYDMKEQIEKIKDEKAPKK